MSMHVQLSRSAVPTVAVLVAVLIVIAVAAPDAAEAALRSAAGSKSGGGGFRALAGYMSRLSNYLIALGVPLAVLGLIYGGGLYMSGSPRAGQVLAHVAVGFIIVVASKGLAA